jgi:hypothetical protein
MQALEASGRDFASVSQTIDMEGNSSKATYCKIVTIPVNTSTPADGGTALAFWTALFPELANVSSPDFFSGSIVTVLDPDNNPIDTSTFQYLLTQGQVAPWMLAGNVSSGAPAQSVQATISATFKGMESNNAMVSGSPVPINTRNMQNQPKFATVTLLTIPGATYVSTALTPGELLPYGLAGYIYKIESIPQYEGSFTIQENEITDQCPMGNNLNIEGSLPEWATMQACVQQVSYDLAAGRTTVTFGPAAHLGAKELSERLKINRGPRWYNLNGNNVQNSANANSGTTLGQNVSQLNPSPGPPAPDFSLHPISLQDAATNLTAYQAAEGGLPGVTIDVRPSGQANYGAIVEGPNPPSTPTLPTISLMAGASGTLGAAIRISVSDIAGKDVWLQEYPCYFDFNDGNGCVAAYVLLLGSYPYKTSIH